MPSQPFSVVESVELLASLDSVAALLRVVCDVSGLGVATIAEVTDERWIACAVEDRVDFGLRPGAELDLESTLCYQVRSSHDSIVISDVTQNPTYCDHPAPGLYGWKSYVSIPVFRPNGIFFGTLCALDRQPAPLIEQQPIADSLTPLARLLGELILQEEQRRDDKPGSRGDVDLQTLREQLLILFEQDLQWPLQALAVDAASAHPATTQRWRTEAERLAQRSAEAADFIRTRLGHGLPLTPKLVDDVNDRLTALIAAVQKQYPDQPFKIELPALPTALRLDLPRLLQALGILLEQAAAQGAPGGIVLRGDIQERTYRLQIESSGVSLEFATPDQLFQPALTRTDPQRPPALALGLYLANEIVRGHGGTLVARAADGCHRFVLTLPTALD